MNEQISVPKDFKYTFWGTCKGKTKDGAPCGQSSIYPNGYCRHHGGKVTPEFYAAYRARQEEKLQRARRRAARRHLRFMRMAAS